MDPDKIDIDNDKGKSFFGTSRSTTITKEDEKEDPTIENEKKELNGKDEEEMDTEETESQV